MENILNKLKVILEKNVEWIAVGLGALFLLWMVYGYIIQKPVTATVAGQQLPPSDVDQRIADGPARALQAAMANTTVPRMEVQDFVGDLMNRLNSTVVLAMNAPWSSLPLPPTWLPTPIPIAPPPANAVAVLPSAAAPEDLKVEQGRSNVQIPPPPAANGGNNNPGSAIVQAGNNQGTPQDRNWVSVSAMIRTKPLADALAKSNVPAGPLRMISILRVELVRQEQDANGDWGADGKVGAEKVLPPIATVNLLPLPSQTDAIGGQTAYIAWAEQSQQALLQPPFYPVLQGDPWVVPGMPQPQPENVVPTQPFDPATFHGDEDDLTPDQRKQYEDYQKQQREQRAAAARAREQQEEQQYGPRGGPGGPPGGYGGPGGGRPAVDDPDRPLTLAQAGGYGGPGPGYGGPGPGYGMPPWMRQGYGRPPGMPMPPQQPQQPMPQPNPDDAMANSPLANPQETLPQGAFDPSQRPDIVIWAHDDTVEPGKTYRYKLRYIIKNPVFQTSNVCNPQKLAEQFYIVSADSDWTDDVSIKSETNVFAVSTSPMRNSVPVKFDIFRWNGGAWRRQTDTVNPGDELGTKDEKTGVDFTTGLTLVDVHTDPRNPDNRIITLMSDSGQLSHHELPDDHNNPEHKRLNTIVNSEPAPGAPGTPGAPQQPSAAAE